MDVHTSLAGQCQDTGHLVGHSVAGTSGLKNVHWTLDVSCTIDSHDPYVCYMLLLLADATVERWRAS